MKLNKLKISPINKEIIEFSCAVDNKKMFAKFSIDYKSYLFETYDSFLINILPMAMVKGEDIYIDGSISRKLFFNIENYLMDILYIMIPNAKKIKITAKKLLDYNLSDQELKDRIISSPLSCGIDSLFTLEKHYFLQKEKKNKISFVINSFSGAHADLDIYKNRLINIKQYVQKTSLSIIEVETNFASFNKINHKLSHIFRNLSVPLIFQKLIKRYLYPSTFSYLDTILQRNMEYCQFDPVILPLISTELIEFVSDGAEKSRIEKTKVISKNKLSQLHLDVCTNSDHMRSNNKNLNCSYCNKCLRTLVTLEEHQCLNEFDNVFYIKKYKKLKSSYLQHIKKSKKSTEIELSNYFNEKDQLLLNQERKIIRFDMKVISSIKNYKILAGILKIITKLKNILNK